MTTDNAPSGVVLRRSDSLIEVGPLTPALLEVFRGSLTYARKVMTCANPMTFAAHHVEVFHVQHAKGRPPVLLAPAPLIGRVRTAAAGAGVAVEEQDLRTDRIGGPQYDRIDPLRGTEQLDILSAIIANDCGIIHAPTGSGKSFLIRQLTRVWPQARFMIVCPLPGVLNQFHQDFRAMGMHDEVGLVVPSQGRMETGRRVTLVTDKSMLRVDPSRVDILIYDEVHLAAAEDGSRKLAAFDPQRRYGFSGTPFGRSDGADLVTESLFGPVICTVGYQAVQAAGNVVPIFVGVVTCAGLPKREFGGGSSVILERHMVWRNPGRNQLIREGVAWFRSVHGADLQVLVSVKTVEHAAHLQPGLPDHALVYGSMDPDKRLRWERDGLLRKGEHPITPDRREAMRVDFRNRSLLRVIATGTWGTGVDFPHLNLVVRADAQGAAIPNGQIPGRVTRTADGKSVGLVLDFDDLHNSVLARRAVKRFRLYRSRGWTVQMIRPPATS
jgi:hypothetical protein